MYTSRIFYVSKVPRLNRASYINQVKNISWTKKEMPIFRIKVLLLDGQPCLPPTKTPTKKILDMLNLAW